MKALRYASLVCAFTFAAGTATRAQSPDPCATVNPDDIAALVTLNQATVESRPMEPGGNRCYFSVKPSLGSTITVELTVENMGSHEAAVARARQDLPFYFDKKPPLVKTSDPGDHVFDLLQPNSDDVRAIHGSNYVTLDASQEDDSAKAHPSWEYRLQRTALQAAGATIVPSPGVAPDPVLPKRQAASKEVQDYATHGVPTGFFGFFGMSSLLFFIGPLITIFVLYRVFIGPRLLRRRLTSNGLPGTARIDSVSDTGVTVNNSPQVRYHCTITPQTGMPYQASTKVLVSRLVAPASRIGATVPVRIDPNNPQSFVFVEG